MATKMSDQRDALEFSLLQLKEECDPQQFQNAVTTLLKIIRNVIANPSEEKYRELKTSNKTFQEKVWSFVCAQQFMVASGWAEVDDKVILLDDDILSEAESVLAQASSGTEKVNGAIQKPVQAKGPQSERERLLEETRRKQMEQMRKEKEEKERISEMIKADRKETQTRKSKDSIARTRQYGANINRFEDIGVDLNSGGG